MKDSAFCVRPKRLFQLGKLPWIPSQDETTTRKTKFGTRVGELTSCDAETRWMKVNTGLSFIVKSLYRLHWLTKLSTCCLNSHVSDSDAKQLLFGVHVDPTFQDDTHEHTGVGWTTSQLGKCDQTRSKRMHRQNHRSISTMTINKNRRLSKAFLTALNTLSFKQIRFITRPPQSDLPATEQLHWSGWGFRILLKGTSGGRCLSLSPPRVILPVWGSHFSDLLATAGPHSVSCYHVELKVKVKGQQ